MNTRRIAELLTEQSRIAAELAKEFASDAEPETEPTPKPTEVDKAAVRKRMRRWGMGA